ncbi:MAG: DUF4249 domain-containing protein [Bacteroidales bacterium]|nr:DUF4249 domain-containing protein [Bacteroidales bacterium]
MKRITLYTLLLALITFACTERVDLNLDETYTRMVVDGGISNDTGSYQITLTKTADYFYNEPAPRVAGATVNLTNGTDNYLLHETEPGISGIYETDATFFGIIGETYTLDIDLNEPIDNLTTYYSSCQMMNVARLDSIQVVLETDWGPKGIWQIRVFAQEPGDETNYYMFHYYRNDTLMTDSIWKVAVSDDKYINGSYINGLAAIYINNENPWEAFNPGDKVTLKMSGITKEYYDFITQVQLSGFNIPFFTGPPANVQGNISNGGIGFFSAYSNTWGSTVVK